MKIRTANRWIGQTVDLLRQDKGYANATQLAKSARVSRALMGSIITGERSLTDDTIAKLCPLLDADPTRLKWLRDASAVILLCGPGVREWLRHENQTQPGYRINLTQIPDSESVLAQVPVAGWVALFESGWISDARFDVVSPRNPRTSKPADDRIGAQWREGLDNVADFALDLSLLDHKTVLYPSPGTGVTSTIGLKAVLTASSGDRVLIMTDHRLLAEQWVRTVTEKAKGTQVAIRDLTALGTGEVSEHYAKGKAEILVSTFSQAETSLESLEHSSFGLVVAQLGPRSVPTRALGALVDIFLLPPQPATTPLPAARP